MSYTCNEVTLKRRLRSFKQRFRVDRSCLIPGEQLHLPFKVPSSSADGLLWQVSITVREVTYNDVHADLLITLAWKDDQPSKPDIFADIVMTITNTNQQNSHSNKEVWKYSMAPVKVGIHVISRVVQAWLGLSSWDRLNEVVLTIDLTYVDGPMERFEVNNPELKETTSQKLGALLDSKELTDVTFEVEGQEIPAHRAILGAMSPLFRAMFLHNFTESQSGIVKIVDCAPNVFREMIKYIYTGTEPSWSDGDIDLALELYIVADKYGLVDLCTRCQMWLMRCLSPDNVFKLLLSSETEGSKIYEVAFRYIKMNSQVVLASEAWQEFLEANTRMAADLLQKVVRQSDALHQPDPQPSGGESKRLKIG